MDLERELFPRVEDFHEQREAFGFFCGPAQQFLRVIFHEPAEVFAGERAVGDDAHAFGAVGDFPRLADGDAGREGLAVKLRQLAPTPDALFEDRVKSERVEHRFEVQTNIGSGFEGGS